MVSQNKKNWHVSHTHIYKPLIGTNPQPLHSHGHKPSMYISQTFTSFSIRRSKHLCLPLSLLGSHPPSPSIYNFNLLSLSISEIDFVLYIFLIIFLKDLFLIFKMFTEIGLLNFWLRLGILFILHSTVQYAYFRHLQGH